MHRGKNYLLSILVLLGLNACKTTNTQQNSKVFSDSSGRICVTYESKYRSCS